MHKICEIIGNFFITNHRHFIFNNRNTLIHPTFLSLGLSALAFHQQLFLSSRPHFQHLLLSLIHRRWVPLCFGPHCGLHFWHMRAILAAGETVRPDSENNGWHDLILSEFYIFERKHFFKNI
jgi:hypothetical protein